MTPTMSQSSDTTVGLIRELAAALTAVLDPELGLDVVELGLVYEIGVQAGNAHIVLGVTTPACPYSRRLAEEVADVARFTPGVREVDVTVTFTPTWSPAMMSAEAQGLMGWR